MRRARGARGEMAQITARSVAPDAGHPGPSLLQRLRREQPWWVLPLAVVGVLGAFGLYSLVSIFVFRPGEIGPYLSPFWSPKIGDNGKLLGPFPGAAFILLSPLAFRGTCYYYRKAYYRSFFWDPPACALGELRHRKYRGESKLPMALNNLHRFTLYVALVILGFLWFDALAALNNPADGRWGFGLGTAILLVNVVLLTGYTFSCHSLRHLAGGGLDCYSTARLGNVRNQAWRWLTTLNARHPVWAWVSLFSVLLADIYIRMLQAGWFVDPHVGF
jgi:hypothetical protein